MGWQDGTPIAGGGRPAWMAGTPIDTTEPKPSVGPGGSIMDAAATLGTGAVAASAAGLAGLAQGAKNLVSPGMPAGDRVRQVQDMLTYQPRTQGGEKLSNLISYPFEKLAEGADSLGGRTAESVGPIAGAAVNTAIQAVPQLIGKVGKIGPTTAAAEAAALARKTGAAQIDAGIQQAREAGYVLPPSQANPSILNQVLEGIGGKIKTAQKASEKNQPVTNDLARNALGIAPDAPLNANTLAAVRQQAGEAYDAVRGAGRVTADDTFRAELNRIAQPSRSAAKDFKDLQSNEVERIVKGLNVDSFDAGSAVDQIRLLRSDADKAYRSGDKTLGKATKDAANALEDQISRHLEATGQSPDLVSDFQNARQLIAKSYTVQKALKPDGSVDARVLARELEKGKPLSDELKTAGQFASQFPKAAQLPEKIAGVPYSMLDAAVGGGAATLMHNPMAFVAAGARPLIRSLITSDPYQRAAVGPPSHDVPAMIRLRDLIANEPPLVPALGTSQGQRR